MEYLERKIIVYVSVVVPVYNVEKYLDRCITSILNQTYPDFELILIDDGSGDSSGSICDAWAKADARIRVFHKENGGLSDARNYGIDYAKGEYITFVDSDDYIDRDYLSILVGLVREYGAQIACVSGICAYEGGKVAHKSSDSRGCLGAEEALKCAYTRRYFGVSAWGKLYKADLFSEIRYPKGRLYEDLLVTPHLIAASDSVAYSSSEQYFWVQREGSIIHTIQSEKEVDLHLSGLREAIEFVDRKFKEVHDAAVCRYVDDSFEYIIHKLVYSEAYFERVGHITAHGKMYWKEGMKNRYISKIRKIEIMLIIISPHIYKAVYASWVRIKSLFRRLGDSRNGTSVDFGHSSDL